MPGEFKNVGGIWERKTKKGDDMLSMMIRDIPYIAFRNTRKKPGEKNPDWQVFESRPQEKKEQPKNESPPEAEVPF